MWIYPAGTYTNITSHPQGNRNVCARFCGSPSNSCSGISLKTTKLNLMVAPEETSGDHQSPIIWEPRLPVQNFVILKLSPWRVLRLVGRRWCLTAQMTDTNSEGVGQMRATGVGSRGHRVNTSPVLWLWPGSCMHRGALASCSACQGPWLMTCRPCSLPPPPPQRSHCSRSRFS